jgi:hypothetical protein
MSDNDSAAATVMQPLQTFLRTELTAIAARRKATWKRAHPDATVPTAMPDVASPAHLTGLALSGGGIRSATFSLGVLQGLHERGLLPIFDYLSTVSGGGFAGGWWSAWLSRQESLLPAIFPGSEQLEPARYPPALLMPHATTVTDRGESPSDATVSAQANDPIHHVRLFSNYLTPRKGALSADTWNAATVISRNLLLTWLMLLPLLFAVVLVGQLYFVARESTASAFVTHIPASGAVLAARLGVLLIPVGVLLIWMLVLTLLWMLYSIDTNIPALLAVTIVGVAAGLVYHQYHPGGTGSWGWLDDVGRCIPWWLIWGGTLGLIGWYGVWPWVVNHWDGTKMVTSSDVIRNTIMGVQAKLFIIASALVGILLIAGFSHDTVWYLFYSGDGVMAAVRKAGGWGAFLGSVATGLYTILQKGVPSGKGGEGYEAPSALSRVAFKVAPTLVLLMLAILAACAGHAFLVYGAATAKFPAELYAFLLVGVLLEWLLIFIEVFRRPGRVRYQWMHFALALVPAVLVGGYVLWWRDAQATGEVVGPAMCYSIAIVMAFLTFRLLTRRDPKWKGSPLIWGDLITANPKQLQTPIGQQWTTEVKQAVRTTRVRGLFLIITGILVAYVASHLIMFTSDVPVPNSLFLAYGLAMLAFCGTAAVLEPFFAQSDNTAATTLLTLAAGSAGMTVLFQSLPHAQLDVQLAALVIATIGLIIAWVVLLGWYTDPNQLGLHTFYKMRLVRAYMGASNTMRSTDITDADPGDDVPLHKMGNTAQGAPYHVINTTLNLVGGHDLTTSQRSAANFVFTRDHCGSSRTGYRPTEHYMSGRLTVGTAVAISGAAASPNMGAKSVSSAMSLLLALFNVRLGFWAPTPNRSRWLAPQARLWPFYLLREAFSQTTDVATYCYLTDGGHFDNTGLYALVERGCRNIVLVDCGADPSWCMSDLGEAVRRCRIDFGTEITLDVRPFRRTARNGIAPRHCVVGHIRYAPAHLEMLGWSAQEMGNPEGRIVWIKPAIASQDPADVRQYGFENTDFPQQSTVNQWYDEAEFESYRSLGAWSVSSLLQGVTLPADPVNAVAINQFFTDVESHVNPVATV